MFKATVAAAEPAQQLPTSEVMPISHLALDLPTPELGWPAYLSSRDIAIVEDGIGRSAISRVDAKQLFDEHRDNDARKAELRAAAEQRAIEADRVFRAQLGVGVPASLIPAGMTYAAAALSAELDGQTYRPRASVVEDLLDNGGGLVFHPIDHKPDDE
jgi:hypothetical protein